jgi:hypothetical protein
MNISRLLFPRPARSITEGEMLKLELVPELKIFQLHEYGREGFQVHVEYGQEINAKSSRMLHTALPC